MFAALDRFADNPDVITSAFSVLQCFVSDNAAACVDRALAAMDAFPDIEKLQHECLDIICGSVVKGETLRRVALPPAFTDVERILAAMEKFPTSKKISRTCSTILSEMLLWPDLSSEFLKLRGVNRLFVLQRDGTLDLNFWRTILLALK